MDFIKNQTTNKISNTNSAISMNKTNLDKINQTSNIMMIKRTASLITK